jgi:hypothetical protein
MSEKVSDEDVAKGIIVTGLIGVTLLLGYQILKAITDEPEPVEEKIPTPVHTFTRKQEPITKTYCVHGPNTETCYECGVCIPCQGYNYYNRCLDCYQDYLNDD